MAELQHRTHSHAEAKIEIRLNRVAQLFNSLDPAPFRQRDLGTPKSILSVRPRRWRRSGRCGS